jgi:hypothetical protein
MFSKKNTLSFNFPDTAANTTVTSSNYVKPIARPDEAGPIVATTVIVTLTLLNILKEFFQVYQIIDSFNFFSGNSPVVSSSIRQIAIFITTIILS